MKKADPMEKLLDLDFLAAYVRYASSGKPEVAPDLAQAKNYPSARFKTSVPTPISWWQPGPARSVQNCSMEPSANMSWKT